jgi:hypothetical protein
LYSQSDQVRPRGMSRLLAGCRKIGACCSGFVWEQMKMRNMGKIKKKMKHVYMYRRRGRRRRRPRQRRQRRQRRYQRATRFPVVSAIIHLMTQKSEIPSRRIVLHLILVYTLVAVGLWGQILGTPKFKLKSSLSSKERKLRFDISVGCRV